MIFHSPILYSLFNSLLLITHTYICIIIMWCIVVVVVVGGVAVANMHAGKHFEHDKQESETKISWHKRWAKDKKELNRLAVEKYRENKTIIEVHSIMHAHHFYPFCFVAFFSVVLVSFCSAQKTKWNLDTLAINTQ